MEGRGWGNASHTIAGVFFTRLVDVLALAFGAALAFVALVADAFFGAAFVVLGLASVFLGLPAVLVPAGFAALVAFCEESAGIRLRMLGRNRCTLAAGFFSLEALAGFAAGSFLANFTVPDGPVWFLAKNVVERKSERKSERKNERTDHLM